MRYLLYILSLSGIIFLADLAYVKLGLYDGDIQKCNAELVYQTDSLKRVSTVLYFGESSNFTSPEQDSSHKAIAELLAQMQPELRLAGISKGAIHASTFKTLINRLNEGSTVKTVIVTMNLRSFGINWIESELETNLSRAEIIYSNYPPIMKKCMLTFKAYDDKPLFKRNETIRSHYKGDRFSLQQQPFTSVYEWDKFMFHQGITDSAGNKDEEKTGIACHFIKNYAFVIDEKNPRINDFDAIVKICREKQLRLIFHILPENVERANALCGSDLVNLMQANAEFLEKRYSKDAVVINNYRLLPDSIFTDRQWPTEHYTFAGRDAIARTISAFLDKPTPAK